MWKSAFLGAMAMIAVGVVPIAAQGISEGHIAQAKAALNLKPEQEKHWPRIAAALRSAGKPVRTASADASFTQRGSDLAAQAIAAKRVLSAALPLIRTLDAEQKAMARSMVRAMGYGHLASRL